MIARCALIAGAIGVCAARAYAASPGFTQEFTADAGGFTGGSAVTHVLSGGVGGAGDPYIQISNATAGFLGAFSQAGEFTGDLAADGVTGFSFWLNDTGGDDTLEIHVGVGLAFSNFWQSVDGFTPPDSGWHRFSVDLNDPSGWVQIIGAGTFQQALASTDRLLFRHDVPPLTQFPNAVAGDFGLDRISVLPAPPPACSDGEDNDGDGLVDYPADPGCADAADENEVADCGTDVDSDGDDACDASDNCLVDPNPDQIDSDQDGYGNACDADYDNNCVAGASDFNLLRCCFGHPASDVVLCGVEPTDCAPLDSDGNGVIGAFDFNTLRKGFGKPPGPSASGPCP